MIVDNYFTNSVGDILDFTAHGKTYWKTYRNGKEITKSHIPDTSLLMRIMAFVLKIVPEKLI